MSSNKQPENDDTHSAFTEKLDIEDSEEDESQVISRLIGSFGRWQLRIILILCWCYLPNAQNFLVMPFFAPGVDHWCKPPDDLYTNWSVSKWKNYSIPPDQKKPDQFDSCSMYKRNYTNVPEDDVVNGYKENLTVISCMYGWDYDKRKFTHSLENEFDLVCNREVLAKTGAASFNAGILVGVVASGQLSDIFGRKITIMVSLICAILTGFLTAFMPSLELFFVTRFILAMSLISVGTVAYVLMMEFIDKQWRGTIGAYATITWAFGCLILPGYAYLVPNWRHLQLLMCAPLVLFPAFWWFVPESIRWLISQGKVEEAEEIAKEAAKVNKRDVQVNLKNIASIEATSKRVQGTILDLFRYPRLRRNTFNLYYNWFVNAFVYFGLALGMQSIGGNLFITFTISGLVEFPVHISCAIIFSRFGRRIPYSIFMMTGGVACISTAVFEKGVYTYDWPIVTLAMVGKFCISATFTFMYLYSIEIFPTPVRNVGLGSSSMFARVGSITAPYVDLLRHVHPAIPLVLFGATAVVAGGLALLLPETKNRPLPQTLKDAEKEEATLNFECCRK